MVLAELARVSRLRDPHRRSLRRSDRYSMTSSARASSDGRTERAGTCAVFRNPAHRDRSGGWGSRPPRWLGTAAKGLAPFRPPLRCHPRRLQAASVVVHSMTSSARSRIAGGIVSPSARATCRLITSSNRVGCRAGVSAGEAPFSILSVRSASVPKSSRLEVP